MLYKNKETDENVQKTFGEMANELVGNECVNGLKERRTILMKVVKNDKQSRI